MTEGHAVPIGDLPLELTVRVPNAEAMEALGMRLAGLLRAGDVLQLIGPLGAGKTTLTRGIGAGLGARGTVQSPTFVLARTHQTDVGAKLVHVDAYRLQRAIEFDDLDIDFARSIVVVEWPRDYLDGLIDHWLEVEIERSGAADASTETGDASTETGDMRLVRVRGIGARWREVWQEVSDAIGD